MGNRANFSQLRILQLFIPDKAKNNFGDFCKDLQSCHLIKDSSLKKSIITDGSIRPLNSTRPCFSNCTSAKNQKTLYISLTTQNCLCSDVFQRSSCSAQGARPNPHLLCSAGPKPGLNKNSTKLLVLTIRQNQKVSLSARNYPQRRLAISLSAMTAQLTASIIIAKRLFHPCNRKKQIWKILQPRQLTLELKVLF